MSRDSRNTDFASMFRIDVSPTGAATTPPSDNGLGETMVNLLKQLVAAEQRQTQLLEQLLEQSMAATKQRATELGQWKDAHPELSRACRTAAETLGRVQGQFLQQLTEEVLDNEDNLLDGEFMLNEFVDRFGPRLAHLNGLLQVLAQLSSAPPAATSGE
jgi:hypothetical protein